MFDSILKPSIEEKGNIIENKITTIDKQVQITNILNNATNIYLGSDWHLIQFWEGAPWRNTVADKILKNYDNIVEASDAYIFLGDLVSNEITDKNAIKEMMKTIPNGHKIMVLGNNDKFPEEFYLELGFEVVCDRFTYGDTVFTHIPLDKADFGPNINKNAHGHIHFSHMYYVRYYNHMDVYTKCHGCKPLLLEDMYDNLKKGKYRPTTI